MGEEGGREGGGGGEYNGPIRLALEQGTIFVCSGKKIIRKFKQGRGKYDEKYLRERFDVKFINAMYLKVSTDDIMAV